MQVQLHCQHFLTTRCCFLCISFAGIVNISLTTVVVFWVDRIQKNLVLTFPIGLNWFGIFDGWALVPLLSRLYDVKKRLIQLSKNLIWLHGIDSSNSWALSFHQSSNAFHIETSQLICYAKWLIWECMLTSDWLDERFHTVK